MDHSCQQQALPHGGAFTLMFLTIDCARPVAWRRRTAAGSPARVEWTTTG